jgi:AcrR family transcriptional regulator
VPKQVDHAARREELAAALWRVVMRDGIEAASIRRVAAEARWSSGSLRHYFATQSELLAFAMELVVRKVRERVAALPPLEARREMAELALSEVLPLDNERRAEMQVWLTLAMQSMVEPHLRIVFTEAHRELRGLCRQMAELLGSPEPDRDGERIHAFIDGLALHAVAAPDVSTPKRLVELMRAELDALYR